MRALRCLLCYLAVSLMLGCSEFRNGTGTISKRIGDVAREPGARQVDLATLTTFGWDRFFLFKPGTSREEICEFIGAGRNVCGRIVRIDRAPDDHMVLLFAQGGKLTHLELHAVDNGRFDLPPGTQAYPRVKAVFRVRLVPSSTGRDTVVLEPP